MLHRNAVLSDIHKIHNWSVADEAARLALVVTSVDIGKVCRQEDTGGFFLLRDTTPTWDSIIATEGLPVGGTTGQVLAKVDGTDYNVTWTDPDSGPAGEAATITVGTVTTGAAGTPVTVTNSGTVNAAVLDFSIPQGAAGADGLNGDAATVTVGTVTTLPAGSSATVTNSGTANAAILDFGIPQGADGTGGGGGSLPAGGTSGQVLTKTSATDYDVSWQTPSGGGGGGGREVLTSSRTYYVATTGSDANDGLSSGTPFLTIARAIEVIYTLDFAGYEVSIEIADGTYSDYINLNAPWVGGGTLAIFSSSFSASAVTFTSLVCNAGGINVYLSAVTLGDLVARNGAIIEAYDFALAGSIGFEARIQAGANSKITVGGHTITENCTGHHLLATEGGFIDMSDATVTITGTPVYSQPFAAATRLGLIKATGVIYSGSVTGTDYLANMNSVIEAAPFPGDSAGSVATGGQYVEVI